MKHVPVSVWWVGDAGGWCRWVSGWCWWGKCNCNCHNLAASWQFAPSEMRKWEQNCSQMLLTASLSPLPSCHRYMHTSPPLYKPNTYVYIYKMIYKYKIHMYGCEKVQKCFTSTSPHKCLMHCKWVVTNGLTRHIIIYLVFHIPVICRLPYPTLKYII